MKNPETATEWQAAVDAAHALLVIDAARQYGLVTGGPDIDVVRCEEILERGRKKHITPRPDAVERFIAELNS